VQLARFVPLSSGPQFSSWASEHKSGASKEAAQSERPIQLDWRLSIWPASSFQGSTDCVWKLKARNLQLPTNWPKLCGSAALRLCGSVALWAP